MDDGGRLGFGTSTPVADLHVKSGNTPTLRLEQDGSSGFTPQTWDLAGNEANIFIRDATNGSTLPIRVRPGASTSAIDIDSDGVGIGNSDPDTQLHAFASSTGNVDILTLENSNSSGGSGFVLQRGATAVGGDDWRVNAHNSGEFRVSLIASGAQEMQLDASGNVTFAGTVTPMSSRTVKENLESVDVNEVLNRVAALELSTWNYKKDSREVRHLSPMAEDFWEIFKLGKDDKGISVTDLSGVTLASIQALFDRLQAKDDQIEQLTARLVTLEKALAEKGQ